MVGLFNSKKKLTNEIINLENEYSNRLEKGDVEGAESIIKNINFLKDQREDVSLKKGRWLKKSLMGTLTRKEVDKVVIDK